MPQAPWRFHPSHDPDGFHPLDNEDANPPPLAPEVVERLGELLRDFYANLTTQPVPEHLRRLLDRLNHHRKAKHVH